MSNVPNKSTGDSLTASEFNQNNNEEKNFIEGAGLTLDSGSSNQMEKAGVRYSTAAQGCVATGITDAYILTTNAPFSAVAPTVLQDSAIYRARMSIDNTGTTTVNVNGLGAKPVKKNDYTDELDAGDITAGVYEFIYSSSEDAFELSPKGSGGGGTANYPWLSTQKIEFTSDDTVLITNVDKKHRVTAAASGDVRLTLPTSLLVDGMTFPFANENASGAGKRLIVNDGTDDIDFITLGDGVVAWSWDADNSQWV